LRRAEAEQYAACDDLCAAERRERKAAVHPKASRKLRALALAYSDAATTRDGLLNELYSRHRGWADGLWEACHLAESAIHHLLVFCNTSDPTEAAHQCKSASRQLLSLHGHVARALGMPDAQARDLAARAERVHELAKRHYQTVIEWFGVLRGASQSEASEARMAEERLEVDRLIETLRVVLQGLTFAAPGSSGQPAPMMKRPVPIAAAAKAASKRGDVLLRSLRARAYPIAGSKGAYVAELTHIALTVPDKKSTLHRWANERYPAE
jgi:hypothetical protein